MKYSLAFVLALPLAAASVRVYQTNSAGDAVHVIDPATNKVVFKVEGIEVPHGVTFSPDGTKAYISCESEGTLWSTDTKTGKLIAKAKLSGHPNNVSTSKDGKYVFVGIAVAPGAVDVIDTAKMEKVKSIAVKGRCSQYLRHPRRQVCNGRIGRREKAHRHRREDFGSRLGASLRSGRSSHGVRKSR